MPRENTRGQKGAAGQHMNFTETIYKGTQICEQLPSFHDYKFAYLKRIQGCNIWCIIALTVHDRDKLVLRGREVMEKPCEVGRMEGGEGRETGMKAGAYN